ncbi:hypothetical protein JCM11251_007114 [Rhodosporidiobolus azoricus]
MLALARTALRCHSHSRLPRTALFTRTLSTSSPLLIRPSPAQQATKRTTTHPGKVEQDDKQPRDLDSYGLATRVRSLLTSASSLPLALSALRSAPSTASTVVVWNVLLNSLFNLSPHKLPQGLTSVREQEAWRIKKAWEVWMEMKRRGVTPSARSYGTFLGGAAKGAKKIAAARDKDGAGGLSGEARGKVETVHKQWITHCERIKGAAEAGVEGTAESTSPSQRRRKTPLFASADGQAGLDVFFETDAFLSSRDAADEPTDGREDTLSSLSPHPTNQYLSFLSSTLASTASTASGPLVLTHLLDTLEAMPTTSAPGAADEPLARDDVSYALAWGAIKVALQASTVPPSSSTPPPPYPAPTALLDRAVSLYSLYLTSTLPPPGSSCLSSPPFPLSPLPSTLLLSLFLSPHNSSTTLPTSYWSTALSLTRTAFGFVTPSQLADLTPPHPAELEAPLARLDAEALGVSLRVCAAAGRPGWVTGWWEQVRDYPAWFGLGREGEVERVLSRENAEIVIKACGVSGDVEGVEEILTSLISSPTNRPTVQTFSFALSSLSRIGSLPALEAAFRVWTQLLDHSARGGDRAGPVAGKDGEKGKEAKGAVARKEHASAAAALVRLALSVRDRSQAWRALKAVSGPFPPTSSTSPSIADSSSPLSPGPHPSAFSLPLFPPPSSHSSARSLSQRSADSALASALLSALDRLLRAPVDKFNLSEALGGGRGEEGRQRFEEWEERLKAFRDGAGSGGQSEGALGEMARRRAALKEKNAVRATGRTTHSQSQSQSQSRSQRTLPAEGKIGRRARRDAWWAERQERLGEEEVEREVFGVDARGRARAKGAGPSASFAGRKKERLTEREGGGEGEEKQRWSGRREWEWDGEDEGDRSAPRFRSHGEKRRP